MAWDIVSQVLIYNILQIYRPAAILTEGYVNKNLKLYTTLLADGEIVKCRTFDLESDEIKRYKEIGLYEVGDIDMILKYNVRVGDIIYVRDNVRQEAYYIKSSEYLELEPYTPFFKHYDCLIKPFTGRIQLEDNSFVTFEKSYFPEDLT